MCGQEQAERGLTERDSGPPVLITNLKALQKKKGGLFWDYEESLRHR